MVQRGRGGPHIRVEGYRELQRAVSKAVDTELPKRIGGVHKEIGEFVISRLQPKAVGAGAGASVRPSATRREVVLRVGGGHRSEDPRILQWGKRQTFPGGEPPERPNIVGIALRYQAEIEEMFLDGIDAALKPPFL